MGSSRIFEWGWAAGILETLAYTGAISAEFCYPILDLILTPQTAKTQREVAASPLTHVPPGRANLLYAAFVRKSTLSEYPPGICLWLPNLWCLHQ